MSPPHEVHPFTDNWAYLKTELAWLDRLLMVAVSRQKRDIEAVDNVSLSDQDRVTSHWWKGIVSLNGQPGYDHARPPKGTQHRPPHYTQHLEARIQASLQQGIALALPQLRDQLQLSTFEKNVLLMALAPEINPRFGRLYGYLQYQHDESEWDLPTVDLCLRLLCRNDQEWRQARPLIAPSGRLVSLGLVEWASTDDTTLLSRHLRLAEPLTTYLLAENPDPSQIQAWLKPPSLLHTSPPSPSPPPLWLPASLMAQLDTLCALAQSSRQSPPAHPLVLLTGPKGTGKTQTARWVAHRLGLPLTVLNLAAITEADYDTLFDRLATLPPGLLLLQQAQFWLGRTPSLEPALVEQWLTHRQCQPGLTLFAANPLYSVKLSWRQRCDGVLALPMPPSSTRKALWKQALPPDLPLHRSLTRSTLAQLPLSGGDIQALAQAAAALARQAQAPRLTPAHLKQALALHYPHLKWPKASPSGR
ncbi:MAG: AAA family ATPase [Leptolyngbya sp.]|nr:AAA family ATPase [Leptolyngbya sp.]